jgi:hypothetical protein
MQIVSLGELDSVFNPRMLNLLSAQFVEMNILTGPTAKRFS